MYKVILVDDEMFVRKGLNSLVNWKGCGFEVVGEADNGEDALALIEKLNPDLVVTDIRMPALDGLQLINEVLKKEGDHPEFIIISGYSDFKYAQQAVRYGVHDFILKPIDQDEMEKALISLAKRLAKQNQSQKKSEELKKKRILDTLIFGELDEVETNRYLSELSIGDSKEYYYMILEVNGLPEKSGANSSDFFEEMKTKIVHIIQDHIDTKDGIFVQELEKKTYGLIIPSNYFNRFQMDMSKFVHWVSALLSKVLCQKLIVYVGSPVTKLQSIKDSYETAQKARQYKYAQEDKSIIIFDEVEKGSLSYTEAEDGSYHLLIEQIEENLTTAAMGTVEEIFFQFCSRKMARAAVLASFNRCVHLILRVIKNMDGEVSGLETFQRILQLQNNNVTFAQLRQLFIEFVLESKDEIVKLRKQSANVEASKIKQYVDLHYQENISLRTIAAKFYMNPVYLGQLFKKTYGTYFKDYLLQVRINEAKRLLRQSEMKIYEIAECVGINNTDYFITIFRKIEKLTPSEYRNKLLEYRKV